MKLVFPQDVFDTATSTKVRREGGLSFRDLAAIEIAAQMSGAITFSALDDNKKAKNLAAIPAIAVNIADALEMTLAANVPVPPDKEETAPIILLHGGKGDA